MEKVCWWGGGVSLTVIFGIVIAKAQLDPTIWYGWILREPHVVPSLIVVTIICWLVALGQRERPRHFYWRVFSLFFAPPIQKPTESKSGGHDPSSLPRKLTSGIAPVKILKADWGNSHRRESVDDAIRAMPQTGIAFHLCPDTLRPYAPDERADPAPGPNKFIEVTYTSGPASGTIRRNEGEWVILPEDPVLRREIDAAVLKYHDEQQAHQETRIQLRDTTTARDQAIESVRKTAEERNAALADLAVCRKECDSERVLGNVARNNSREDREEIQKLKAFIVECKQRADAPRVVPARYVKSAMGKQDEQGMLLVNDGKEVAHDVSLQSFALPEHDGHWIISFGAISRLAKDEERLAVVEVSGKNTGIDLTWPWNQWMKSRVKRDPQTAQPINPPPVGFDIVYRDHSSNWYRSRCELWQDVANYKEDLEVRFIGREKIPPPVASSASVVP